jgi:uncharacterized protein YndB with AHSA1/START domain
MSPHRHGSETIDYPSSVEVLQRRCFEAPIDIVFEVLSKPDYIRQWGATGGDVMTICDHDLRVGGDFRNVFVTPTGVECSFRGTFLEIEAPHLLVCTWLFEGWPDAWAVSRDSLSEVDGVTTLTNSLVFADEAGAANMIRAHERARQNGDTNGLGASFDAMDDLIVDLAANHR